MVQYESQPRSGPALACRRGFQVSRGQYLLFLDADDRILPAYLVQMVNGLEQAHARVAFPQVITVAVDGREKRPTLPHLKEDPRRDFMDYVGGRLCVAAGGAVLERTVFNVLRHLPEPAFRTHGFDRVMIGHVLAHHPAIAVPEAVIELHDHPQRLRYDVASACATGLNLVRLLFDPLLLPDWALAYEKRFEALLLLEQATLLRRQGRYGEARRLYLAGLAADRRQWLRVRNLRRLVICSFSSRLTSYPQENGGVAQ